MNHNINMNINFMIVSKKIIKNIQLFILVTIKSG